MPPPMPPQNPPVWLHLMPPEDPVEEGGGGRGDAPASFPAGAPTPTPVPGEGGAPRPPTPGWGILDILVIITATAATATNTAARYTAPYLDVPTGRISPLKWIHLQFFCGFTKDVEVPTIWS